MRLRFGKRGRVRFISHRDVARAFERAFRIEALPLAFTQGFAPRPRISFGLALPTGYESGAEYVDVALTDEIDLSEAISGVSAALPEGIDVIAGALLEPRAASLQQLVTSVAYEVEARGAPEQSPPERSDVEAWVEAACRVERLDGVRRRKGSEIVDDLRPAIRRLAVVGTTSRGVTLDLEVSTQPRAVRPSEVLGVLGPGFDRLAEGRVVRTNQWIERDGSRLEPLEADTRVPTEVGA